MRHAGPDVVATTTIDGAERDRRTIKAGSQTFSVLVPEVAAEETAQVSVQTRGQPFAATVTLHPVRHLTIYVLSHSHHDLGYTDLQANVERKQMENVKQAIAIARKTADYPEAPVSCGTWRCCRVPTFTFIACRKRTATNSSTR